MVLDGKLWYIEVPVPVHIGGPDQALAMDEMTTVSITTRQALLSDTSHIARLATQLFIELGLEYSEDKVCIESVKHVTTTLMEQDKVICFLAEVEGKVVAFITMHRCAAIYAGGDFGEISELYVAREYRGLKIGQALLTEAKEYAKLQGWKRIELGAPAGSLWANTFSFYQECGFEAIGPRLRYQFS